MRTGSVAALAALLVGSACAKKPVAPLVPGPLPEVSAMREFVIPWENAFPSDIAVDSAGRVWFTDRLIHAIGMFDPATQTFQSYPTPTRRSTPYGLIAAPDGTLWYAASGAGRIGRIDPKTRTLTDYEIAGLTGGPHLLAWREGEIWFSARESQSYGRFDPRTGGATVYRLPGTRPYSVAATRDGIWMCSYNTFRLIRIDPATAAAEIHELWTAAPAVAPTGSMTPEQRDTVRVRSQRYWGGDARRIAADASGNVWFTDFVRGRIVRYDPAERELAWFDTFSQRASEPYGITVSGRGHVWYGEKGTDHVVVLHPTLDVRLRVAVPTRGGVVRHLVVDERRGRVWVPLSDTGRLGLIELR